ncbi:hypothetical protein FKP32DRAFT_1678788 [Trametes sanguinea]|nr:hypothetical protein FKP32DRAFT_1678788 [Trametes sanguinea]
MASTHPITQNVITHLNESLNALQRTLGSLGEDEVQRIRDDAQVYLQRQIQSVNTKMQESDKAQNVQVEELKAYLPSVVRAEVLFKKVFEEELVKELQTLIEAEVLQEIDDLVKAEVKDHLPEYLPQELQDEMLRHEAELADLEKQLHNAENVRANAQLRLSDYEELIQPLYNAKGEINPAFPKTLGELFSVTNESAVALLKDYRPEYQISDSRDKNVNELMRLCGVRFQLVRRRSSS